MKPLTAVQRQQITSSLFWLLGVGAIATVAAPTFIGCPAVTGTHNDESDTETHERVQVEIINNNNEEKETPSSSSSSSKI
jgi:hypothetical protein